MAIGHTIILYICTGKRYESTPLSEKLAHFELRHTTDTATNEGPQYDGIYACIDLPSLMLGTVGGGTGLATQREALSLMGCYGKVSHCICMLYFFRNIV